MQILQFLDRILARILLTCLALYRAILSPDHSFWANALSRPPYCKHIPSCSSYAVTAIERFGGIRGGWMAMRRLGRCVPWKTGGYDPVPDSTYAPHACSECSHSREASSK
jgi:uncharacterized protein